MMKRYRIAWQSKFTGLEGQGGWHDGSQLDYLRCELAIAQKRYPDIDHWIEEQE